MPDLLAQLSQALKPQLFGDCDQETTDIRLQGYILEAEQLAAALPSEKQAKATEAWARYRAYADAADYWLGIPEQVDVASEGQVNMGDLTRRITVLERNRNYWKAIFDDLTAAPITPGRRGSHITDVEVQF
jgi:hypothetical protein